MDMITGECERGLGGALTFAELSAELDEVQGGLDAIDLHCPPSAEEKLQEIADIFSGFAVLYNIALKGVPYASMDVEEEDWQRPVPLHLRLNIRKGLAMCRARMDKLNAELGLPSPSPSPPGTS